LVEAFIIAEGLADDLLFAADNRLSIGVGADVDGAW
jgi:hypothetical protein